MFIAFRFNLSYEMEQKKRRDVLKCVRVEKHSRIRGGIQDMICMNKVHCKENKCKMMFKMKTD